MGGCWRRRVGRKLGSFSMIKDGLPRPEGGGERTGLLAQQFPSAPPVSRATPPPARLRPAPPPLSGKMGKKIGAIEVTKRIRRKASL